MLGGHGNNKPRFGINADYNDEDQLVRLYLEPQLHHKIGNCVA